MGRPLHVLVIAYDFPPHGAVGTQRTLRLVRYLASQHWRVTVLTGAPSSYLPATPVDEGLLAHVPANVEVLRARAWRPFTRRARPVTLPPAAEAEGATQRSAAPKPVGALRRAARLVDAALGIPDKENGWILPAIVTAAARLRGRNRPDVVFSSAPPWSGQIVARSLKTLLRRPWVADFRDPWARAPWRENRPRFVMRAAQHLEHWVVGGADRIVFVSDANCRDFERYYGSTAAPHFTVVPNGCDTDEFADVTSQPRESEFVLLHAGSLYGGRNPLPLMRAISKGIASGRLDGNVFRFRQVGPCGAASDEIARERERLGLTRVMELVPRVQRRESLREIVSAQALLILQPGTTLAVPGKLYEYFAAGRPIFAVTEEGETADLVRQSGIGVVCAPSDEDAMLDGLVSLLRLARSRPTPPGPEMYDGRIQAAAVAELLTTVCAGPSAVPDARGQESRL